jgi:beta-glucosidase
MCIDSINKFSYIPCKVEWEFGTSLSYTTFAYSNLSVHPAVVDEHGSITVSLKVTNTGNVDSLHTVLIFLFDSYRRVSPEYKLLRRFEKVFLPAGTSSNVIWSIATSELEFVGVDSWLILENGKFFVGVGSDVDCRKTPTSSNCASFELSTSSNYNKVCSTACSIWQQGVCEKSVNYDVCTSTCREQNWSWEYVNCLESFVMGKVFIACSLF